jgi:hypothetical protein
MMLVCPDNWYFKPLCVWAIGDTIQIARLGVFFLCQKIVQMNKNEFFRFHLNIYVFLCIIMVKEELEND